MVSDGGMVFGLSFGKVLLLVAVVVVVWIAVRVLRGPNRAVGGGADRGKRGARRIAAEDMVACPRCGVFVLAHRTEPCTRPECPYR